jgi:hypothetical protein
MAQAHDQVFPLLSQIAAFKGRHLAIPGELYAARLKLLDADRDIAGIKKRLAEARDDVKDSESEIALEVAALKEQFTNETARKAEAASRLKKSAGHQALIKAVAAVEDTLFQAEHTRRLRALDVEKLEDEQRALSRHTELTCAESLLVSVGR